LLENAIRHNVHGGRVAVEVLARADEGVFAISNTGPHVPADEVRRLLQPFQRLAPDRTGDGVGLGLSIVAAIATAHDAALDIQPGEEGGLSVEVRFPRATAEAAEARDDSGAPHSALAA
jgi:signal transduction histidine kinase